MKRSWDFLKHQYFCLHFYIFTIIWRGRSLVDKLCKLELSLAHSKRIKKIALYFVLCRDTKLTQKNKTFLQFTVWNLLMNFRKPHNNFYQNQGVVSRKIWYCEMNVRTYRGTLTLFLCIFALLVQVVAFWSHNLSCSLARKKLWDLFILSNMISTRNQIFICQLKWFKNVTIIENLAFWVSSGPMVW